MPDHILVIEDETALRETLIYNLQKQGYQVSTEQDGAKAILTARSSPPDLILLDLMLPGLDGFEVCRILRQEMNVPILMLTARADEIDRVIGLEVGADDYITKPFSMRELLARVKAQLRRVRMDKAETAAPSTAPAALNTLQFGNLQINITRHQVLLNNQPLDLKPKEYELMLFLARHHGKVLSRELILQRVWEWDFSGGSRTVDVHVRWLREKIEDDPSMPKRIVTVRGAGYRFDG
ncbi:MAG: response regulator transcription factor [Anaerolineales bacterium]